MALNPFFLQGSASEQRLVQDLINEQLKIYGVDVIYIPRKFVRKQTIIKEIQSSVFDDNFIIEAYVNTYEGYSGQGDILSKFGMNLKDELSLIISRERFEDFISTFLSSMKADEIELTGRPREGDIVYFPLGQRIFEVKFVEHEQPFYQLGKLYVYELKCELFEYEDEVIATTINEIDEQLQFEGQITTLQLVGIGSTAKATASVNTGYISKIYLNDDGYGYALPPTISITPAPLGGINATAVAITTSKGGARSVYSIELINAGAGYTISPTITFFGGGGVGASATCSIETVRKGVIGIAVTSGGIGYTKSPQINIIGNIGTGITAIGKAVLGSENTITDIRILNPGIGYTVSPSVVISAPSLLSGFGVYRLNEIVIGSTSQTKARVKYWDQDTKILKVSIVDNISKKGFYPGELIVGQDSNATYSVSLYDNWSENDKYNENLEFQVEANNILDFSESNPFGTF